MKVSAAVLLLFALAVVGGCAHDGPSLPLVVEGPSDRGGHEHDPVREHWEDRASLESCGSVVLAQGETLRKNAADEVACLRGGLTSGTGAELEVESPTTEGDPIRAYYRVTPDGTTEVYSDNTQDAWGNGRWTFVHCESPSSVLQASC